VKPRGSLEPGSVALLAEVLRGAPRLDGALCTGKRGHFAEAEGGSKVRVAECIALCRRCPALEACQQWASSECALVGVVAGRLHAVVSADDGDDESPRDA
jgi:WhiB family transcriptional regulator, redox-sensing transcriptional regulator